MPEVKLNDEFWQTDFQINTSAQPPFGKISDLIERDTKFAKFWKESGGKERNIYDYHCDLAGFFVLKGWSDQEIVDSLVYSIESQWDELKYNEDYFRRVLFSARQMAAISNIKNVLGAIAQREDEDDKKRAAILDEFSSAFGVRINKVIKYKGDPPMYDLETERGAVEIGSVDNIISQTKFRYRMADAARINIPIFKTSQWHAVAQSLLDVIEERDVGDEATRLGGIRAAMQQYLEDSGILDDVDRAA